MLLVWHHRPHLLSLLLLRGDAGLQVRRAGADLPASHGGLHTENSDIAGQLHRGQNEREHPSIRVIKYICSSKVKSFLWLVVSIQIKELCTVHVYILHLHVCLYK